MSVYGGLCNGTRLKITKLFKKNICGRILNGDKVNEEVFIPKIKLTTDQSTKLPFILNRRQFPITLAFAITINKSQGQSFENVGLYIHKPLFSHGQLYVALSRCKNNNKIKIQNATDNNNNDIPNIVWSEIL